MSLNIETIILDFLSPNESIRKNADSLITSYFNSMSVSDLSNFYSLLKTSQNNNVQIYASIYIKNYIEQKITSENRDEFIQYINTFKYDILNIILNGNLEKKTINLLLISLCKGLSFFQIDMKNYYKVVYELGSYIFQFYSEQKNNNNGNVDITKTLFSCYKFIKYIDKDMKNIQYENLYNLDKFNTNDEFNLNDSQDNNFERLNLNFYNLIVEDYDKIYQTINDNNNINSDVIYEYIILYLKIFKYSLNYLKANNREKILEINYNLLISLFNKINTNKISFNNFFDIIISLSNKIILNYLSTHIIRITLPSIKNYSSFFYSFISDANLFSSMENLFSSNKSKFILDIIKFLYKLIDLVYISFPEYTKLCKENHKNNFKEITDYINQTLFTKENTKLILSFIIKNCFIFNDNEIYLAQESCENFYLCFTEYSSLYDLKTLSGNLCNLIYTIFRKKYIDIFQFFENNLISLTLKENQLLQISQNLSGEELNLKCALLLFFYYLEDYYNLNTEQNTQIIEKIFLTQIDEEVIIKKGKEIFSTFIIIRLLTKIITTNFGQKNFKKKIIEKIIQIFFSNKIKETLIELAYFDMFNEYIENEPMMINNKKEANIFPKFFFQNYIIKISEMINKISSPELHSKIIETTNNIINIMDKDELNLDFNIIIPFLELIWVNKCKSDNNIMEGKNVIGDYGILNKKNREIKFKNKIYIARRNLIKLINIIIKKIGFYTYNNENNNNNFLTFHEFIYQIINYTFTQSSSEEKDFLYPEIYNLLIIIQDNFAESISLSSYKNINDMKNINTKISNNPNFKFFFKFFDFFNKIFEQSSNIENNIYILSQIFIIEQFIPFCFIKEINEFLIKENFIDKAIYVLNNMIEKNLEENNQFIFNIMEYILYIINIFPNEIIDDKNKYTDFIYQFIIKIFTEVQLNKNNLYMFFGALQLSNRLIFVKACKNIIWPEFNSQVTKMAIDVYNFINNVNNDIKLNLIQKNIFKNLFSNLIKLYNINNGENGNNGMIESIKNIYKDIKKMNKKIISLNNTFEHWLFFFNKITNDLHFYKFNSEEDQLRYEWTGKFEKRQIYFSLNKEFNIKYFFLIIDPMVDEELS